MSEVLSESATPDLFTSQSACLSMAAVGLQEMMQWVMEEFLEHGDVDGFNQGLLVFALGVQEVRELGKYLAIRLGGGTFAKI